MAQAAKPSSATPASAEAPAPPKRRGKLLLIILLVAVLILILAVVGVGALLLMKKNANSHGSHDEPAASQAAPPPVPVPPPYASAIDLSKPPVFVSLDPFTVNLLSSEDGESHYLQAEITLRVSDLKTAEALKGWMPEIRNKINLILSTKSFSDVQGDNSHAAMQNEILRGLNTLFGVPPPPPEVPLGQAPLGPIQGVLFVSFIVQ